MENNENFIEGAEQLQAINRLLTDYSKSQSSIIKDLRNAIVTISIVAFTVIILMVGGFFWYESQFRDEETTTIDQQIETETGNQIVNGIGDINYGQD